MNRSYFWKIIFKALSAYTIGERRGSREEWLHLFERKCIVRTYLVGYRNKCNGYDVIKCRMKL